MENKEKKELNLGQEIAKEAIGDVCGIGAGLIVGVLADSVVDAIPGVGKGLKFLMKAGVFGLQIASSHKIRETMQEYTDTVFAAINAVGKLFSPKEAKVGEPVEAECEAK